MAIEKQLEYSQMDDELCSLVFQKFKSFGSPPSINDAIIIIDDEDDETLESKTNSLNSPSLNSLVPCTDAVIIIDDDDEEETLEPKKKKPRLGSWWDDVDAFNELSCVVKGLPKSKDSASIVDSWFPFTNTKVDERSLSSSIHHENLLDLREDESYSDSITSNKKENQDRLGYGHVSLEDLVKDPWRGGYVKDIISTCFSSSYSSSFSDLLEKESNTNKDDAERSSYHDDNFIDLSEDEIVGESSNRGNRHVSLEELGVSVEDLKSMPWDPIW